MWHEVRNNKKRPAFNGTTRRTANFIVFDDPVIPTPSQQEEAAKFWTEMYNALLYKSSKD